MKNQSEIFKNFKTLDFPERLGAVYIIFLVKEERETPVYIGETDNFLRRISDYMSASFKAPTDFKVGEAIKYFQEKNYKVIIRYVAVKDEDEKRSKLIRRLEEKRWVKYFQDTGSRLLNELIGYNYKIADENRERRRIQRFCDNILSNFHLK